MSAKFLSPEAVSRLLGVANSSYRPKEIVDMKEKIEAETRAAELNVSVTGVIDYSCVQKIVEMKLQLDGLYIDWTEGKIS